LRNYIIRRIIYSFLMLFVAATAIFFMLRTLPGGPFTRVQADRAAEMKRALPQSHIDRINALVGLDKPIHEQYFAWLRVIASGDLGESWAVVTGKSVVGVIVARVPYTLLLMLCASFLAFVIAVPAGVYSALHPYSNGDLFVTSMSFFGIAMPSFWFGVVMISVFYISLGWLPYGGIVNRDLIDNGDILGLFGWLLTLGRTNQSVVGHQGQVLIDGIKHLILPTVTLSLISIARWSRFVRAAVLDVIAQDYVRTALAYGVPRRRVIFKHILRNSLIPLITVMGIDIPALFTGAIIVELVFTWPGIGLLYVNGIKFADWPMVQGLLIINTILIVCANLIADVSYAVADPRIKYS
jgi:peptide/nickel transport system permease protein